MSSLAKCRRVKRPAILAKRSELLKSNFYNKRSYKPLYEKLKANNNALAKALAKEKQESQYLFSQNLDLTSELHELGNACNARNDIISNVLKNSKVALSHLITATGLVTNTIVTCQRIVTGPRFTPRKSTSAAERRESNRRLSGKSPARGVVQPMVSGHMITKPTINLSRLNIQREYRVQNSPNLSDIGEVLTTPEQSPTAMQSTTPVRVPIARPLNYGANRVNLMPERIQGSMRASDESERRSSVRVNRKSGRHSLRRSRPNSSVSAETQNEECLRSPRVSLHDVSRLLQNSQSVNIRTLLETSIDMDLTDLQQTSMESEAVRRETILENSGNENEAISSSPRVVTVRNKKKGKAAYPNETDDPMEGPSWLLNNTEVPSSSDNRVATGTNNNRGRTVKDNRKNDETLVTNERTKMTDVTGDDEEDAEADEQSVNLTTRWVKSVARPYQNFEEDRSESTLPIFVTRKRGSNCDDTDDFTLMWRPAERNYNFDLNDLELPVLEAPIQPATRICVPETDGTTNLQFITTQNFDNLTSVYRRANDEDSMVDADASRRPLSPESPDSVVEQDEQPNQTNNDEDDDDNDDGDDDSPVTSKRKRPYKRIIIPLCSPSEPDWSPALKRKDMKEKRHGKSDKDPSSAKVVLRKLKHDDVVKNTSSSDTRQSQENDNHTRHRSRILTNSEASSESEVSSNGSFNNIIAEGEVHERPRRQKSTKNLKEPSLRKKLRRH